MCAAAADHSVVAGTNTGGGNGGNGDALPPQEMKINGDGKAIRIFFFNNSFFSESDSMSLMLSIVGCAAKRASIPAKWL